MRKVILLFTAGVILASCGEEAAQTKTYYMENDAERQAKLTWCADRPDQLNTNANCINAGVALHEKIEQLKQDRILIRQKRWDTRSSLIIEQEKCGTYKNTESYKSCRNLARKAAEKKHAEMTEFNNETKALANALK